MEKIYSLTCEADTQRFAHEFAQELCGGECIGLSGELGAGKTTWVRYLVKALGSNGAVSSPTYVLCHEYPKGRLRVEHWDLYRVGDAPEELFEPPRTDLVRIIEWWERAPELQKLLNFRLQFKVVSAESREVEVLKRGAKFTS